MLCCDTLVHFPATSGWLFALSSPRDGTQEFLDPLYFLVSFVPSGVNPISPPHHLSSFVLTCTHTISIFYSPQFLPALFLLLLLLLRSSLFVISAEFLLKKPISEILPLLSFSWPHIQLSDHNDICFFFIISSAFLSFLCYAVCLMALTTCI
jgi:hypothetical protein